MMMNASQYLLAQPCGIVNGDAKRRLKDASFVLSYVMRGVEAVVGELANLDHRVFDVR